MLDPGKPEYLYFRLELKSTRTPAQRAFLVKKMTAALLYEKHISEGKSSNEAIEEVNKKVAREKSVIFSYVSEWDKLRKRIHGGELRHAFKVIEIYTTLEKFRRIIFASFLQARKYSGPPKQTVVLTNLGGVQNNERRRYKTPFQFQNFASATGFSSALFFKMARDGRGPRVMRVGRRTLITKEADISGASNFEAASAPRIARRRAESMTFAAEGSPPGGGSDTLKLSSYGGVDLQANIPESSPCASENRAQSSRHPRSQASAIARAIFETSASSDFKPKAAKCAEAGDDVGRFIRLAGSSRTPNIPPGRQRPSCNPGRRRFQQRGRPMTGAPFPRHSHLRLIPPAPAPRRRLAVRINVATAARHSAGAAPFVSRMTNLTN